MTGVWARVLAVTMCTVPVLVGATACRNVFAPPPCMPPEFSISPGAAKPGDQVTVSTPDTTCDARYGADAQVYVELLDPYGTAVLAELAPMTDDGGFTVVFTVPPGLAPGKAGVTAYPYNLDWCDDTGANKRAVNNRAVDKLAVNNRAVNKWAGAGPQTLVRVSCAQPLVPLEILGAETQPG